MGEYRLYLMSADGHIQRAVEFECESDEDAIALVERRGEAVPMELWEHARRVKVFPAGKA